MPATRAPALPPVEDFPHLWYDSEKLLHEGGKTMPVLRFVVPPGWDQKSLSSFLRKEHQLSGTTLRAARRAEGGLTMDGAFIRTVDPVRAGADRKSVV